MFQNWLNNLPKDLAYVLEKKEIKKNRFPGPKRLNQSTEVKNLLFLPIAFSSRSRCFSYRSISGLGPVDS